MRRGPRLPRDLGSLERRGTVDRGCYAWRAAKGINHRVTALHLGLGLYVLNLLVGVIAQWGGRFGAGHHVLYAALVLSSTVAAGVMLHPALLITLAALAIMPMTRPGTVWHPLIAVIGVLGYVIVFLDPSTRKHTHPQWSYAKPSFVVQRPMATSDPTQ